MSTDDRDPQMEERLREALAASADTVQPGGDGLMRIQQRIGARRTQQRWTRPLLVMGSVVVVAAVAVGAVTIARSNDSAKVTPSDRAPSSTTEPVGVGGFPAQGFFPFSTAAEEATWEQQYADGDMPWIADPVGVATSWVPNYLEAKDVDQVVSKDQTATKADVTLGRNQSEGGLHPVVVVHLVKFHKAWIVTGASDPQNLLTISSPEAGATVDTPLTVTGPGFGVDEVAKVELREAETPDLIAEAPTDGFGNGTPQWSATLGSAHFHPTKPMAQPAVLVVYTLSAADGGVAQLTAQKVVLGLQSAPAATGAGFYGVQGGVIERFEASGAPQGPVDGSSTKGTVFEVRQFDSGLYFTAKVGDCLPTLYSLPTGGGTPTEVVTADKDYGIVGFDLSADGTKLTYLESSGCNQSRAGMGKLVFENLTDGSRRTIDFPSEPPAIIGDPVWEADGVHVDAYVRTGMEGYLARYDSTKGSDATPSSNPCGEYDPATQLTGALDTDADGTLWFAGQTGASMQVLSCKDGQPNVELTVSVNDSPTALSVNPDGQILLTDSSGRVWAGSAGGTPKQLRVGGGVTSATW
jgi:hypothetical protein